MKPIIRLLTLCPDLQSARNIAGVLLEQRLVACANIGAQVESHYVWQGSLQQEAEIQLWMKTSLARAAQAITETDRLHPYEVPMIAQDTLKVSDAYADWVDQMTS